MALKALHLLACLLEDCSEDTGLEWNRSDVIKRKKKRIHQIAQSSISLRVKGWHPVHGGC